VLEIMAGRPSFSDSVHELAGAGRRRRNRTTETRETTVCDERDVDPVENRDLVLVVRPADRRLDDHRLMGIQPHLVFDRTEAFESYPSPDALRQPADRGAPGRRRRLA